ncbi:MAG: HEAT repeat domain-containing protein, partial [Armatimonadetes bacterium]|nr:HEAT repeat domain-containing protein [Armatimonadota bacterium]
MDSFVSDPAIWTAIAFVLVAGAVLAVLLLRSRGERKGDLRRIITLLRATDPNTRIQTLEKTQTLPPTNRAALARMLRSELAASSRGGRHSSQQVITIWFIRQVLALLGDLRPAVRTDAARVLGAVMGRGASQLAGDTNEPIALSPSVAAAVELAGGRVLTQSEDMRSETRVLALAEMLEAGLRPLAIGMQALDGIEDEAMEPLSSALRDRSPRVRRSLVDVLAAMGGERSIEMLLPLLQDPSPDLRAQAARALGNLRAETAASQLTDLMRDPIDAVRGAAAAALAEMEMKSACGS